MIRSRAVMYMMIILALISFEVASELFKAEFFSWSMVMVMLSYFLLAVFWVLSGRQ